MGHRVFYPIAQVSYSAHLLHEMFMFWLFPKVKYVVGAQVGVTSLAVLNSALVLVMTLFCAAIMYLVVEEPILRRRGTTQSEGDQSTPA